MNKSIRGHHYPARIAPPGTLLLAMYGQGKTRGKVAILELAASMNQACAAIEVGSRVDAHYLFHYLESRYVDIRAMSNSGSQDNLSGELVRSIPVAVPPIGEQRAVAGALHDADELIRSLERLIVKKREIKQGVMQELLTGRTRLAGFTEVWGERSIGSLIDGLVAGTSVRSVDGQRERETQNRVVKLFVDQLEYDYGGNREDFDNLNVDEVLLRQNLHSRGYDEEIVGRAVQQLLTAVSLAAGQSLYDTNRKVYNLLRYGVKVKRDVGEKFESFAP